MWRAARALTSIILGWFALVIWPQSALSQQRFRTSLTATVSRMTRPAAGSGGAARDGVLRCRQVTLHWAAIRGATRYTVFVSATGRDAWSALPAANACGARKVIDSTTVIDVEPTTGGATVVRRLYYKVVAYDGDDRTAHVLGMTTVVPVELP